MWVEHNSILQKDIQKPSTAIVLAGGLGTRLRAIVSDRPKVLALAAGRPFLDYGLAYLAGQGIKRVILSVGYLAEQVMAFAGDGKRWGLEVTYSVEETPLGTGGALLLASRACEDPFFALNGDTLFAVDLERLWKFHSGSAAAATIALLPVEESQERGCVTLAGDGRILSFNEKPVGTSPALVNGGVYALEPAALEYTSAEHSISIERDIFPRLSAESRLYGQVQDGYFVDIGTPHSLAAFEADVNSGKLSIFR